MKTIFFCFLLLFPALVNCQVSGTDTTKTFLVLIGGGTLPTASADSIALFNNVILQRFNYDDIGGDTYAALRSRNPDINIYLYQYGYWDHLPDSSLIAVYRRSINRFRDIWDNHPEWYLHSATLDTIHLNTLKDYLLDFGNSAVITYWLNSTYTDIISQAWVADGIFSDVTVPLRSTLVGSLNSAPVDYPYDNIWTEKANAFIDAVANNYSGSQLYGVNYGSARADSGLVAWSALNNITHKPTFAMEEAAFCSWYGYDVSFYSDSQWLNQLKSLDTTQNIQTFFQGLTQLSPGETGTDNYSHSVNFYDALWFSLTSFKLGQSANSVFGFGYNSLYTHYTYFPEFDIKIGNAESGYQSTSIDGTTIYFREFVNGYVYVNPTNSNVTDIPLPVYCRELNHSNISGSPGDIPVINTISLDAHRGTILLKTSGKPALLDSLPVLIGNDPAIIY